MKKFSKAAALLAAGALLFGGLFLSCDDGDDGDDNNDTVTGIYVEVGSTAKTTYTAGDKFDATGITVYGLLNSYTVTGSDPVDTEKVKTLTDGITYKAGDTTLVSGTTEMTTEMTKVTVTYGNYSDSFDITVSAASDNGLSAFVDSNTATLVGTAWWNAANQGTDVVELAANESITYTFKVAEDGADCLVEAYDSAADPLYLSTTSQLTAWGGLLTAKAGTQSLGTLKAANIYSAKIAYDGTAISVVYTDLGTNGSESTELFSVTTDKTVTAPVKAHLVAEWNTFYVKSEKTAASSIDAAWDFTGNARDGKAVDGVSATKGGVQPSSPIELTTNKTGSGATMTVLTGTKSEWNSKLQFSTGSKDVDLFSITTDAACTAVIKVGSSSSSKTSGKVNALKLGDTVIFDFDTVDTAADAVEKTVSLAEGENKFTGSGVSIFTVTLK